MYPGYLDSPLPGPIRALFFVISQLGGFEWSSLCKCISGSATMRINIQKYRLVLHIYKNGSSQVSNIKVTYHLPCLVTYSSFFILLILKELALFSVNNHWRSLEVYLSVHASTKDRIMVYAQHNRPLSDCWRRVLKHFKTELSVITGAKFAVVMSVGIKLVVEVGIMCWSK